MNSTRYSNVRQIFGLYTNEQQHLQGYHATELSDE